MVGDELKRSSSKKKPPQQKNASTLQRFVHKFFVFRFFSLDHSFSDRSVEYAPTMMHACGVGSRVVEEKSRRIVRGLPVPESFESPRLRARSIPELPYRAGFLMVNMIKLNKNIWLI